MADWKSSMKQTFEYYIVDPNTWRDDTQLTNVKTATIERDSDTETLGSATIDVTDTVGECYVRIYLVTIQNGVKERHPLGTFLVQTPSSSFNGTTREVSMDAYTPLLELKEKKLPIGYYVPKSDKNNNDNADDVDMLTRAYIILRDNMRAPIIDSLSGKTMEYDFVADPSESVLAFVTEFLKNAKYKLALDELGRVYFEREQKIDALEPIWTYNDDNSSILYPEITVEHDIYEIPNRVEVTYTNEGDSEVVQYFAEAENNDLDSPTSIPRRGRKIVHRVTDPEFVGVPTKAQVQEYADNLLKELSTVAYSITYTHGYCPVHLGDCVRLNYTKAGLTNIKAKVISQSIECEPGCPVTETAIFTKELWR